MIKGSSLKEQRRAPVIPDLPPFLSMLPGKPPWSGGHPSPCVKRRGSPPPHRLRVHCQGHKGKRFEDFIKLTITSLKGTVGMYKIYYGMIRGKPKARKWKDQRKEQFWENKQIRGLMGLVA